MNIEKNESICGILVVDKDKGMTSHDVVYAIRRTFNLKKVGHAGTLDPDATGVLVILIGKATKLSNNFLNEEKEYTATIKLGEKTTTADASGDIISTRTVHVTENEIKSAIGSFLGELEQIPPMVSAKKVNGKRLYELARKGIEVERKPQKIIIKENEILKIELPYVMLRVLSSKGTYIRQLAEDIGEKLGCGGHLTALRRMRSGAWNIDKAVPFSELIKMDIDELDENITRV